MNIDGKEYVEVNRTGEELRIVCVGSGGTIFVGMVDLSGDNENITIRGARCIIKWGTTKHVAELAERGPLDNTRLGTARDVDIARSHLQYSYLCSERWL